MPLAFESRSHEAVAFGFFNIATDMLLLEELFFFADRFCQAVVELARAGSEAGPATVRARLAGWRIAEPGARGNLHGAIAGLDLTGFIGATYRRWPFPRERAGFKQDPDGRRTQAEVSAMIAPFGSPEEIALVWDGAEGLVSVGEVAFAEPAFAELVAYVERGGMPRYRAEIRPGYVGQMTAELEELATPFRAGIAAATE